MPTRLRLCDEDLEKYGGPEWVVFDEAELNKQPNFELIEMEAQLKTTLDYLLIVEALAKTSRWKAARVWIARRIAGDETRWSDFNITTRLVIEEELEAGDPADVDPPSGSSSTDKTASRED